MNITRSFKNKTKTINYSISNCSKPNEQKTIDTCIAFAYNSSALAIKELKTNSEDVLKFAKIIYGENFDPSFLSNTYKDIIKAVESKLKIRREKIFITEENEKTDGVLASAKPDTNEIIIYDSFFAEDIKTNNKLNTRIGTILHEIAHLNGLTGDSSFGDVNSAECLKNFTLLLCKIISEDELPKEDSTPNDIKGKNGELPDYRDQPRIPAGNRNGGQWTKDTSSGTPSKPAEPESTPKEQKSQTEELDPALIEGERRATEEEAKKIKAELNKEYETQIIEEHTYTDMTTWEYGTLREKGAIKKIPETFSTIDKDMRRGLWMAFDLELKGFKPGSDVTVLVKLNLETYKKYARHAGTDRRVFLDGKNVVIAYDKKANEKGEVLVERLGIIDYKLNEYDNINVFEGGFSISSLPGRPNENFKISKENFPEDDIRNYAASHAISTENGSWRSRDDVKPEGGIVEDYEPKENEKLHYEIKFRKRIKKVSDENIDIEIESH